MVRAWYMDNNNADQRLEHHRQPPKFISLEYLFTITGVEYFKVRNLAHARFARRYMLNVEYIQFDNLADACLFLLCLIFGNAVRLI
jgi:hypothetical protein